ncbi:MAG: hypothetical protein GY861_08610 [bacterium]|nr:hypothetical protein [bacterium]
MLKHAFEKVKGDVHTSFSWINYLKQKDLLNDKKHEQLNRELGSHSATILMLKQEIKELKRDVFSLKTEKISQKTRSGQVGTRPGTSRDISRDMSRVEKTEKKQKAVEIIDKSSFKGSNLELINLLYHSDKPLGYPEIAMRLSKSEKSIRNLICEVRKKGIKVKDKHIGAREKGFFIDREEKIKISGR